MEPGGTTAFAPTLGGATLIALVHLLAPRFRFMSREGNPWAPASAGVAMAYVFMDIFPHLAKSREKLGSVAGSGLYGFLAHNVYLVALAGFAVYLGIILVVMTYRQNHGGVETTLASAPVTLWTEIVGLVAYNVLIGYLLTEQLTHRPEPVLLFALAMALHFAGIDCLLREHFPALYDRTARFALAAGIYAGWIAGVAVEISDQTLALWYSFLAGGIIVVTTVYELPRIRSAGQYASFCASSTWQVLALARFQGGVNGR